MNRREFLLRSVSAAALVAALPVSVVMGRAAKAAVVKVLPVQWTFYVTAKLDDDGKILEWAKHVC